VTGDVNRPLTPSERRLAHWMLKHGSAEAATFLSQLENAEVTRGVVLAAVAVSISR